MATKRTKAKASTKRRFAFDFSGMACPVLTPTKKKNNPNINVLFLSGANAAGVNECPHIPILAVPVSAATLGDTLDRARVSVFHAPGGILWYLVDVTGFDLSLGAGYSPVQASDRRGLRRKRDFENLDSILNLSLIGYGATVDRGFFTSALGPNEALAARFALSGGRIKGGTPSPGCANAGWVHPQWDYPKGTKRKKKKIDLNDRLRWTVEKESNTVTINLKDKEAHVHTVKLTNLTSKPLLSSLCCLCPSQKQRPFKGSMNDVFLYNRILIPPGPKAGAAAGKRSPIKRVPTPDTAGGASTSDPTCPLGMAY